MCLMPDEATPDAAQAAAPAETPVAVITPQDATAEHIARGLNPEQAKAFKASRAAKKAKQAAAAAVEVKEAAPAADPKPAAEAPKPEIIFGEEEAAEAKPAAEEAPAEIEDLSEAELAKLDEKARKRITEASKEAAKVRKRAQEAEAKLSEKDTELAELRSKIEASEKEAAEGQARAAGLAGNAYVHFKDAHAVAAWAENAKEALTLISAHEREVKAGRREKDDPVLHLLPNGQEIELRAEDAPLYQGRVTDAQAWFTYDGTVTKHREAAAKLADKHQGTQGYKEAREAYLKSQDLPARLDELVAKAALYDVLQSRRASITFPDTAGAASKAPSAQAAESKTAERKQPPVESPASTPRLAQVDGTGSDLAARKSLLMEKAKTAKTDDERQKYLKQAIMLGNPRVLNGRRAAA